MSDLTTLCDGGCGTRLPDDAMWRMTRRPDQPDEWTVLRELGGREFAIHTRGPEHMRLCPDCWRAALGFVLELRGTRERRVRL